MRAYCRVTRFNRSDVLSSHASTAASYTKNPLCSTTHKFRTENAVEHPRSAFFMNPMVWPISQHRGAEDDLGMAATRGFSTQQEASSVGYTDGASSASSGGAPNALGMSAGSYYPRSYYNCERRKKSGMSVQQTTTDSSTSSSPKCIVGGFCFFSSKGSKRLCVCA